MLFLKIVGVLAICLYSVIFILLGFSLKKEEPEMSEGLNKIAIIFIVLNILIILAILG